MGNRTLIHPLKELTEKDNIHLDTYERKEAASEELQNMPNYQIGLHGQQ